MVTETSRKAYKELNEDGVCKTQKEKIMRVINIHYNTHGKGLSNREIANLTNFEINAVSGRVNDLKKDGLIELSGKKKDVDTHKDVQVVIPVDNVDAMQKDAEGKIKLLLTMYGYKDIAFKTHNNIPNERSLTIGYFKPMKEDDIIKISNNTHNMLEEMSVWDDDAGRKYWYIIKEQEL